MHNQRRAQLFGCLMRAQLDGTRPRFQTMYRRVLSLLPQGAKFAMAYARDLGDVTISFHASQIPAQGGTLSGTLGDASATAVDGLLNRANRKRGRATVGPAKEQVSFLPPARAAAQPAGACGAPAVADRDEQTAEVEAAQGAEEARQQQEQEADESLFGAAGPASGDEEDGNWEDVSEGLAAAGAGGVSGGAQKGGSLELTLPLSKGEEVAAPVKKQRRKAFTKEDKLRACLVHRCHLLCLLARGLLFDAAAGDPVLQAQLLSMVPPDVASLLQPQQGQQLSALRPLLDWFRSTFKETSSSGGGPRGECSGVFGSLEELEEAKKRAKGMEGTVAQLQQALERRSGTEEELAVLFVAILRAHGFAARTLRSLHPIPLNPADVQRQEEQSALAAVKRSSNSRRQQLEDPTVAAAAGPSSSANPTHVEDLEASRSAGLESSVTLGGTSGRGGGRGRGRGSRGTLRERGGKQAQQAQQPAAAAAGRKRKKAGAGAAEDGGDSREGEVEAVDLTQEQEGRQQQLQQQPEPKRRKGRAKAAAASKATTLNGMGGTAQQEGEGAGATGQEGRRKRKCEEEEEHQIALAMAATAFEASNKNRAGDSQQQQERQAVPGSVTVLKRGSKVGGTEAGKAGPQGANQPGAGVAYSSRQSGIGICWAEVFCGATDVGRWVHVDPLRGWIDREGDVEGLSPLGQPLAYVVAFAGGGAKDVIQRYSSSIVAAEKLRDSDWWVETLRPLRAKEVAATLAAAVASNAAVAAAGGCGPFASPAAGGAGPSTAPAQQQQQQQQQWAPGLQWQGSKPSKALEEAQRLLVAREDAELAQRAHKAKRGLPTTIDGFKSHPLYVLQRHIGKYQAVHPEAKVCGMHRGEAYYLREDLMELHTAQRWRREGWEVIEEELAKPCKRIKKRGQKAPGQGKGRGEQEAGYEEEEAEEGLQVSIQMGDAGGSAAGEEGAALTALYGPWQTKAWVPPAASGGKVPRNERGNVEVPPFAAALPAGTVHLRLPYIAQVCRKLQVDYAPALTGFEIKGGRSVPVIEGVVVCQEFEEHVVWTYLEEERKRHERAKQKREEEAQAAWRQLLQLLLTRVRLGQAYGSCAGPGGPLVGGEVGSLAEATMGLLRENHQQHPGAKNGAKRGGKHGANQQQQQQQQPQAKVWREEESVVDLVEEEEEEGPGVGPGAPSTAAAAEAGSGKGGGAAQEGEPAAGAPAAGQGMHGLEVEEI